MDREVSYTLPFVFIIILLVILGFCEIFSYYSFSNLDKDCEEKGYDYAEKVTENYYNCCRDNLAVYNESYFKKDECIKGGKI